MLKQRRTDMRETIEDIRAKLLNEKFNNKVQICHSLVTRLLGKLGWDIWNPVEVYPRYQLEFAEEKVVVDLALFTKQLFPAVFITTTAPGELKTKQSELEKRLLRFTGLNKTLIVIHTDGLQWKFYYSHGIAAFATTCFKTFNMLENKLSILEQDFTSYSSKNRISDGAVQRDAYYYLRLTAVVNSLNKAYKLIKAAPFPRLSQVVVQLLAHQGLSIKEQEVIMILEMIEKHKAFQPSSRIINKPKKQETPLQKKPEQKKPDIPEKQEQVMNSEAPPAQEQKSYIAAEIKEPSNFVPGEASKSSFENETLKGTAPVVDSAETKPDPVNTHIGNLLINEIINFTFLNYSYSAKSWKELLITFCEIIYSMHSIDFEKCLNVRLNNRYCFSRNSDDFSKYSPVQINSSDYYIITDLSPHEIVELVYQILELFYYSRNDIEIKKLFC